MLEALELPFFQRALAAGLLASVACGVLGPFIVVKRITSLAGGLSHAAFGGVGLSYLLGLNPMLGAASFGVGASVLIGVVHRRLRSGLDALISMVWAVGMALGILFVALTPGYVPELMSYLIGSLLFTSADYVLIVLVLDFVVLVCVVAFFKELQAVSFDEEFAEITGVRVELTFLGLLVLTALAIVTLIRIVGVILAIALLTIPAALARQWSTTLPRMMVIATLAGASFTTAGLFLSFELSRSLGLSAPPGPLIILIAALAWAVSAGLASLRRRSKSAAAGGDH